MGRGDHKFPFTFVLPPELPTSFEGQYGFVRYTIKVTIERSWKFDHEYKFPVTVLEHFDLNRIPAVKVKKTFKVRGVPEGVLHEVYFKLPRS